MSVLYQNPTDQSVQSQRQVYKKRRNRIDYVSICQKLLYFGVRCLKPPSIHAAGRLDYGKAFLCVNLKVNMKSYYKGNYGPEIPTKKGPYDFSSNSF